MKHPDPQNYAMAQFHACIRFAEWVSARFFDDPEKVRNAALSDAIGWASR